MFQVQKSELSQGHQSMQKLHLITRELSVSLPVLPPPFLLHPIAPESLQLGVYWWFLFFPKERSPEHNSLNLSPSILRSQTKPKRKMKHTVERKWWFVRNSWGKLGRGSASTDLKAQEKCKVFYVPTTLLIWFITQKELSDGKKDTMLSLNFK